MIQKWLRKHRWVNEMGKLCMAAVFLWFAYNVWQGAILASKDFSDVEMAFKPFVASGIGIGVTGMIGFVILLDVIFSLPLLFRKKGEEESNEKTT